MHCVNIEALLRGMPPTLFKLGYMEGENNQTFNDKESFFYINNEI